MRCSRGHKSRPVLVASIQHQNEMKHVRETQSNWHLVSVKRMESEPIDSEMALLPFR